MANTNKPQGLAPVKYLNGADWDGSGNVYHIPSSDSTNSYYIGDVVRLNGSGDANGIPGIVKTAAGDGGTLGQGAVGVIVAIGTNPNGPWVNPNDLTKLSAPATKAQDYYALVVDDPNVIFEVLDGTSGTALAAADIGQNCNLSITANQTTGFVSSSILNNASKAATLGLDVKLLGLARIPGNGYGYSAKWLVMINSHAYRAAITGI